MTTASTARIHRRAELLRIGCLLLLASTAATVANAADDDDPLLPTTSRDFLASFSCDGASSASTLLDEGTREDGADDPFYRWVLAARHTTYNPPGWEVPLPAGFGTNSYDGATKDGGGADGGTEGSSNNNNGYYARVFDLIRWSMEKDSMPVSVEASEICHKGMGGDHGSKYRSEATDPPPRPSSHVPKKSWSDLWNVCHKQLQSTQRISSSTCIDVPGMVVENPAPPWKENNPCGLRYRMVDGAHRLCLRKYLLMLLEGELMELKERLLEHEARHRKDGPSSTRHDSTSPLHDNLHLWIQQTQRRIEETELGSYLVMDQATFQSMLIDSDPHATWAKGKAYLKEQVTSELRTEWEGWMGRVMDRVSKSKEEEGCDAEDGECSERLDGSA